MNLSELPTATNIADEESDEACTCIYIHRGSLVLRLFAARPKPRNLRAAVYGFYEVDIKVVNKKTDAGDKVPHEAFTCERCGKQIYRNLTTKDKSSSGGLRTHAERCYGVEAVQAAYESADLTKTRDAVQKVGKKKQSVLTSMLTGLVAKGKELYSTMPLSKAETR